MVNKMRGADTSIFQDAHIVLDIQNSEKQASTSQGPKFAEAQPQCRTGLLTRSNLLGLSFSLRPKRVNPKLLCLDPQELYATTSHFETSNVPLHVCAT